MVAVGDDQLLVAHLAADKLDDGRIGDPTDMMQNSIFIADFYIVFCICYGAAPTVRSSISAAGSL